jgi:hypothetical protein
VWGSKHRRTIFHAWVGSIGIRQKRTGKRYAELVLFHPVGSGGHVVLSDVTGEQNIDAIFFMFRWTRCGFHKKHARTRYTELEFLHQLGSAGHVAHSGASEARNIDVLFFMLGVGSP